MIQAAFLREATVLRFADESKALFAGYTSALRPGHDLKPGDSGIIPKASTGTTTITNIELIKFWNRHISEHAHY